MVVRLCNPPCALDAFVAMLWHCAGPTPVHARERLLPDGAVTLVINLHENVLNVYNPHHPARGERRCGSLIAGPRDEFSVIDTACQTEIMGVQFKPGGAYPFFNVPVDELCGLDVELDALWGSAGDELRDKLIAAPSVENKFRVLGRALERAFRRERRANAVVDFALQAFHSDANPRVTDVVARTGYSARRFIDLFTAAVGLTPKRYQRVHRFQRVVRQLAKTDAIDFSDVAIGCGYFDQAHFIHDFQAFAGVAPTAYLARRGAHANHVSLDA
jgi:AraC-like DNA-binding protein